MKLRQTKGFTLLEIIIVIIIVGVLASLALPRFFTTVEFSRSTEALSSMSSIRQSMARCYLATGGSYNGCTITTIDLADPGTSPGAHFNYGITVGGAGQNYTIRATRNTVDGGNASSTITITETTTGVTRSGATAFVGIR